MSTTQTLAIATTLFTLPIHFKNWATGSKGHKDLLALAEKGGIADFEKEVTKSTNDEGVIQFKRNSLNFSVSTLDIPALVADKGLTPVQAEHLQELVNAAIKKDVQALVSDTERTTPVTDADLPSWETVLSQPYNKRPNSVKVTVEMIKACTEALIAYLTAEGIKQGGLDLTASLCTKKFSISALNTIETPLIEHVQSLINGWFDSIGDAEAQVFYPVVSLWTTNIEAKLNPKQEEISIDIF